MIRNALSAFCLMLALLAGPAARAASVNPFDPSLSPDLHGFASCNFLPFEVGSAGASCTDTRVVQNPTTLTQVNGLGTAQADLQTGTLRSRGVAEAYRFGADDLRANGGSIAQLYDTITVNGGFTGQVELRMAVSGSMLASTAGTPLTGQAGASLFDFADDGDELGSASIFVDQFTSGGAFISNEFQYGPPSTITTNADALGRFDPSDIQAVISMFFDVTAANPSFTFGARLSGSASLGPFVALADQLQTNDVDFGNTARLSLIVPAGVTWTSSSGTFLIPEPSALGLLGVALGCCALMRRARLYDRSGVGFPNSQP